MLGLPQKDPAQAGQTQGFRAELRLVERVLRYWTQLATRRGFPRRDEQQHRVRDLRFARGPPRQRI